MKRYLKNTFWYTMVLAVGAIYGIVYMWAAPEDYTLWSLGFAVIALLSYPLISKPREMTRF